MAELRFVEHLPDLLAAEDYVKDSEGRRLRFQIRVTPDGIEVLGDAVRPVRLEQILDQLGAEEIERMLCG